MDDLPDGYEIRLATIEDLDAVGAVMLAADVGPSGGSDLSVDMIRDLWSSPSIDLARDAWVVVSAVNGIVAYAHLQEDGETRLKGWGDVHPEHLARGIGSALLERAEARASERFASVPTGLLEFAVADWNHDASGLVRSRGFEHVRSFRHMQIDLDGAPIDPGEAPDGIEIRGIDPTTSRRSTRSSWTPSARSGATGRSRSGSGGPTRSTHPATTRASGSSRRTRAVRSARSLD